jgi:hypothetical protein
MNAGSDGPERGVAILTVLLVLLSLLVLTAPFLMTARNASRASTQAADRVQARVALDSAGRHARAELGGSHPAFDETPYFDDEDELSLSTELDPAFLDSRDTGGVMWDVTVRDVAALIDLNSAPPQMFANMMGAATRLTKPAEAEASELMVSSTFGFPDAGFLWVGRELIGYTSKTTRSFTGLHRGLAAQEDEEGDPMPCGPQPAMTHNATTIVIDQRAFAPVLWRTFTADGIPREFDAPEQIRDAGQLALGGLDEAALEAFGAFGSVYGGVRGGREWQRPARLSTVIQGGVDCAFRVQGQRWFNVGSTIQITDGTTTELGVVQSVDGGNIRVMEPFVNDYDAFTAEVRTLARRPVNINLASPETLELLLTNLQFNGKNQRVTTGEAKEVAGLIVASRPFDGLEDFLLRVVLPAGGIEALPADAPTAPAAVAGGGTLIDEWDALAIYANALNANDVRLAYSTMPFSFTTRDVYDLDLRATVNAKSGVERVTSRRNQVELVVPQAELMQLWARQEDFDESQRLDREAPYWATGPDATARWDQGNTPPTRFVAHIGTHGGKIFIPGLSEVPEEWGSDTPPEPEHVFASREENGWAVPQTSRVRETSEPELIGRMEHFDHETRDPEGRYLPDEIIQRATTDDMLQWTEPPSMLTRCVNLSMWIKPRDLGPGTLLDIGQTSIESDRISLLIEGNDLVLRVLDAVGDHPDTAGFTEAAEARFSLASGEGPGLAPDTWSHVAIDVRGTRPDQISMLVDGRAFGVRQPGLTRLASPLSAASNQVVLEDGEGFPTHGVVRIGREFIEYTMLSPTVLDATHQTAGFYAGHGGRNARIPFLAGVPDLGVLQEINDDHQAGEPVELYGYTLNLTSNAPGASSQLGDGLGRFAVGKVMGLVGAQGTLGDIIDEQTVGNLGAGLAGDSQATGLVLEPADDQMGQTHLMDAFQQGGGYAAIVQKTPGTLTTFLGGRVNANQGFRTTNGHRMFGCEVIKYTHKDDTTLYFAPNGRNVFPGRLFGLNSASFDAGPHAFVTSWQGWNSGGVPMADQLEWQVFVVPISIPVPSPPGGSGGFLNTPGESDFAQITYVDTGVENTEWVRYDTIASDGHLVRNGASGLDGLHYALARNPFAGIDLDEDDPNNPPPTNTGPGSPKTDSPTPFVAPSPAATPPPAAQVGSQSPIYWIPYIGADEPDEETYHVTRAALSRFQFRGVFGTSQHAHPSGTAVLPVFRVAEDAGFDGGWPGRLDPVLVVDEDPFALGWPGTIHRAYRPEDYALYSWDPSGAPGSSQGTTGQLIDYLDEENYLTQDIHIAMQAALGAPVPHSDPQSVAEYNQTRFLARVLKHPSGELPRIVDRALIGGTIRGGEVPAVVVDEIAFGSAEFGTALDIGDIAQGGVLVLNEALFTGDDEFRIQPSAVRLAGNDYYGSDDVLDFVPEDAGLLRMGSEIVCYGDFDASTGVVTIAPGGRALLGTEEESHTLGTHATLLEGHAVSTLTRDIDASEDFLPLEELTGFPSEGTVLIDDELIHYTRRRDDGLEMPRASTVAGEMNRKGGGIFRGRYGTEPAGHLNGTPVILFPFRYWDRQADEVDGPELSYFGLSVDQPNAFWRSLFWQTDATDGSELYVLQRAVDPGTDSAPPWDGNPDETPGLEMFEFGMPGGEGNVIGLQAGRMEWRVFVRFQRGAFDALTGLSHGWKRVPRLRLFGVEYLGPNQVLRRVDE